MELNLLPHRTHACIDMKLEQYIKTLHSKKKKKRIKTDTMSLLKTGI